MVTIKTNELQAKQHYFFLDISIKKYTFAQRRHSPEQNAVIVKLLKEKICFGCTFSVKVNICVNDKKYSFEYLRIGLGRPLCAVVEITHKLMNKSFHSQLKA